MKTKIMGILNITPDSFSDGGLYMDVDAAVKHAAQMMQEGADSIDVGGESTRPGAESVSVKEEIDRVVPVIRSIRRALGDTFPISIDTYKAEVANEALAAGATMVNSMGGLTFDPSLGEVVAKASCPFIIYHILGVPRTMQQGEIVYDDVVAAVRTFFEEQIIKGKAVGIKKEQFIVDPGIGFGKTVDHNLTLIRHISDFASLGLPILVGVSRKSHLGTILKDAFDLPEPPPPGERLEAALAETAIAVLGGSSIIRTHDVAATKKCVATVEAIMNKGGQV